MQFSKCQCFIQLSIELPIVLPIVLPIGLPIELPIELPIVSPIELPGPGPDRLDIKCYLAWEGTRVVGGERE